MINIQHYDFIELKDLEIPLFVGVHHYEKNLSQKLRLDIKIFCDFEKINDVIHETIDYSIIKPELMKLLKNTHFELIETFANFTANWINEKFNAIATEICVKKYHAVPDVSFVGVRALRFSKSKASAG